MNRIQQLLGVGNTTSNELALAESGLSDLIKYGSPKTIFIHAEAEIPNRFFR